MTTYQKPSTELKEHLRELMEKYHPELVTYGVRVDMLLAFAPTDEFGFPRGPALKWHGIPALALASITKLKDRAYGRGDCEILIDGDREKKWHRDQLRAVIDHELTHFELVADQTDDLGRPKLRLRPHDVDLGWFDCVARRHGDASMEVTQAKSLVGVQGWRQLYLPGLDLSGDDSDDDMPKPTLTRKRAAALLDELFGGPVDPKSLVYAAVPHRETTEGGEAPAVISVRVVEAWVDPLDRAVIFADGAVIETTRHLQLSARWSKGKEDAA